MCSSDLEQERNQGLKDAGAVALIASCDSPISGVSSFHPAPLKTVKPQKNGVKNGVRFWDVCQIIKDNNLESHLQWSCPILLITRLY